MLWLGRHRYYCNYIDMHVVERLLDMGLAFGQTYGFGIKKESWTMIETMHPQQRCVLFEWFQGTIWIPRTVESSTGVSFSHDLDTENDRILDRGRGLAILPEASGRAFSERPFPNQGPRRRCRLGSEEAYIQLLMPSEHRVLQE